MLWKKISVLRVITFLIFKNKWTKGVPKIGTGFHYFTPNTNGVVRIIFYRSIRWRCLIGPLQSLRNCFRRKHEHLVEDDNNLIENIPPIPLSPRVAPSIVVDDEGGGGSSIDSPSPSTPSTSTPKSSRPGTPIVSRAHKWCSIMNPPLSESQKKSVDEYLKGIGSDDRSDENGFSL